MAETIPMAMSLPARYYIDPDYYRAELEWYFGEMWFHAGRADEIPERGDFVVREIAGESLIVVRGDRGEISAFYNVCRHRGTRLCEQQSGTDRVHDSMSLSRLDLRPGWLSRRRPAHGPRRGFPPGGLPARPAGGRRLGRPGVPQLPGAARGLARGPARRAWTSGSGPGGWASFGRPGGSSTTSRPTGS